MKSEECRMKKISLSKTAKSIKKKYRPLCPSLIPCGFLTSEVYLPLPASQTLARQEPFSGFHPVACRPGARRNHNGRPCGRADCHYRGDCNFQIPADVKKNYRTAPEVIILFHCVSFQIRSGNGFIVPAKRQQVRHDICHCERCA